MIITLWLQTSLFTCACIIILIIIIIIIIINIGVRGSVVGWGSIADGVTGFFDWPNPSNRTMALGSTQPLTEISTRNLPGSKGWPVRKADNITAICEPIV
jgi:hypothetical protein